MLLDGENIVALVAFAGQDGAHSDSLRARQLSDPGYQLLVEGDDLRGCFVAALGEIDFQGKHVMGGAANIHGT